MTWGFQRLAPNGLELFEKAFRIRHALFGPEHPKTVEAKQAVQMQGRPLDTADRFAETEPEVLQDWDGNRAFLDSLAATNTADPEGESTLKQVHRRLVKMVHPDLAQDERSFKILNKLMIDVNAAAAAGNLFQLRQLELRIRLETAKSGRVESEEQ